MPKNTIARLIGDQVLQDAQRPRQRNLLRYAAGVRWQARRHGSQQLLGRGQQLGAILVVAGVILPRRVARDRLPLGERCVVQVIDFGANLFVNLGDGNVVGLGASRANVSMSAPTAMMASCCALGSLSNTSLDISSGSSMNQ